MSLELSPIPFGYGFEVTKELIDNTIYSLDSFTEKETICTIFHDVTTTRCYKRGRNRCLRCGGKLT